MNLKLMQYWQLCEKRKSMNNLLFILTAMQSSACPTPEMINWTHESWNELDRTTYARALKHCEQLFNGEAPCMKKFIKKKRSTYYVICGAKRGHTVGDARFSNHYWYSIVPSEVQGEHDCEATGAAAPVERCGSTCPSGFPTNIFGGKG